MKKEIVEKCIDTLEIAGKTALSCIPIGGALVTAIYDVVKENVLQKRQAKWKDMVEKRLAKIESTLEDIGENEAFATMLIKTTELAMKTAKEEKLEYLVNALVYSVDHSIDEDKLIIFMSYVEKYSVAHIKILNFFNDPEKFGNASISGCVMGSPAQPLCRVYPEVATLKDKCINDLYNDGLMTTQNINVTMTSQGMFAKRTTGLGDEFLKFLGLLS